MSWLPPSLLRMRLARSPAPGLGLWLPVFMLWPLWLLGLLAFFVTVMAATTFTGSRGWADAVRATRELHRVVCGLRGATCAVQHTDRYMSFVFV